MLSQYDQDIKNEPIFSPHNDPSLVPVKDSVEHEFYKKLEDRHWTSRTISYADDFAGWAKLSKAQKAVSLRVFAGFANLEFMIMDDARNMASLVTDQMMKHFNALKEYNEGVHNESYQMVVQLFADNEEHRRELNRAIREVLSIKAKADLYNRWARVGVTENVVICAFFEKINFASSFWWLLLLKKTGLIPGTCLLNDYVIFDETLHGNERIYVYREKLVRKLSDDVIYEIARDSVQMEIEFFNYALGDEVIPGVSKTDVNNYIRFLADGVLVDMGHKKLFSVVDPFAITVELSLENKVNNFEKQSGEYKQAVLDRKPTDFLNLDHFELID